MQFLNQKLAILFLLHNSALIHTSLFIALKERKTNLTIYQGRYSSQKNCRKIIGESFEGVLVEIEIENKKWFLIGSYNPNKKILQAIKL